MLFAHIKVPADLLRFQRKLAMDRSRQSVARAFETGRGMVTRVAFQERREGWLRVEWWNGWVVPQVSPLRFAPVETTKLWVPRLSLPQATEVSYSTTLSSRPEESWAFRPTQEDEKHAGQGNCGCPTSRVARCGRDAKLHSANRTRPHACCAHFHPTGMAAQVHRSHISLREIWGTHSF